MYVYIGVCILNVPVGNTEVQFGNTAPTDTPVKYWSTYAPQGIEVGDKFEDKLG